ncbi:histidinol-phosphate transaminase [Bacteriovoracaceae bacterium]|nr:histidinol-phosphate transaminase [Bacteriovoracaceae bacterium]
METKPLIPEYIYNLKPYTAGKPIEELAKEKGIEKISKLASNENPLGPSPYAIREMTYALWNTHRYPDMHGLDLKNAICTMYKGLDEKNIILGSGSEGIMGYIARAFIQPGDEVLTCEKTFIGFHILALCSGSKIVLAPRTEDHRFNIEELKKRVNEKTKVVYIANPDNPTGTYITEKEFNSLMEVVPSHTIVILDEAYFEYARSHVDYPDSMNYRYDNVITLRTFSKAFGIAGIRIGYGYAHPEFIKALHKVKLPFEPNIIAQRGAIGAIKDYPHLERTLNNNTKRYYETMNNLKKWEFETIPSVTNFICFKTGSKEASLWLYEELLNRGVIVRPLISNGMPEFLRISLGLKIEMQHFFDAMEEVMPNFNKKFRT